MTRRRFGFLALLGLVAAASLLVLPSSVGAALGAAAAGDNPPHGNIIGKVFEPPASPGGPPQPVEDAIVRLFRNGQPVAQTHTNAEGKYAFPNVPAGPYRIVAFKQGVGHGMRRTIVFPAQTVIVPVLLHE